MNLVFILQLGVLALTVILWWRVQQGLSGQASTPPLAEWERLRATVEQLTADLERRAVVAEQRVAAAETALSARLSVVMGENSPHSLSAHPADLGNLPHIPVSDIALPPPPVQESSMAMLGEDRFAHAESLIMAGVTDAADIARQTGVSRGEAELLLSLRTRRV